MGRDIIISVDGGGTHTTAIAVTTEGRVVGRGSSGPANHVLAPIEVVRASLKEAIGAAISSAGVSPRELLIVAGDTAGIGYLREGAEYVEGIIAESIADVPIYLVGDMVAGFFGALPYEWGVVATAGTGSSIYGKNKDGKALQAGGWGHILGDEGSAYDIAVNGLRAAARAFDGRGKPTSLTEAFPRHLALPDMIAVAITIYMDETMTRDRVAKAALVVSKEAQAGDGAARSIMEQAAGELALAVITVGRNLAIPPAEMKVSWSGSVFLAGEMIIAPFSDAIRKVYPDAEIRPPGLPAVGGGVRVAFDRLGLDFSAVRERLKKDLS